MEDVTITVSTPGLHTAPVEEVQEYPFEGATVAKAHGLSSHPPPPTTAAETATISGMGMVCHATQTDSSEDEMPPLLKSTSPARSRSPSPARKSRPLKAWTEQIRNRLASPHGRRAPVTVDASGVSHLAPPMNESPLRPATPAADLYRGQADDSFGITFEQPDHSHLRRGHKPPACPYSHEDHKHRMLMDWLERRASV
ncbi:hypothetical protein LTR67_009584 [Exophiala xenobiotica]|jgi:hypothetical protein